MASKKKPNKIKMKLKLRQDWELPRGHQEHQSGMGPHDNRPKRQRTRKDQQRQAIEDYDG